VDAASEFSSGKFSKLGESDAALERSARARRLSIIAYFFAGRYEEAADAADRSLAERADNPPPLRYKIACCGLLGRIEEGRANVERLLSVSRKQLWPNSAPFMDRCCDGIRTASKSILKACAFRDCRKLSQFRKAGSQLDG
jgi:hypothetical protein